MYNTLIRDKEKVLDSIEYSELDDENKYNRMIELMKESVFEAPGKANHEKKKKNRENVELNTSLLPVRKKKSREKKRSFTRNPVEWWDAECDKAIKDRKQREKHTKKIRI